jgi:hypothetical protein
MKRAEDTGQLGGEQVKERLRELAGAGGALVFGVAEANAFKAAPEGYRPEDVLPGARSVVVVGGAKPRAGDWRSPNYQHMEMSSTNDRITGLCMRLCHTIEREAGYYAVVVPPGVDEGQRPFLDIASAAEFAGCGSASLAGPVLHPEHGFMYFAVLLTTLEIPADAPLAQPACPAPECVELYRESGRTPCTAVCPIGEGGCLGGEIENDRWTRRQYDRARCMSRVYNYWGPSFQKVMVEVLQEPDHERRRMMINSSLFTRTLWSMTYANINQGQCFECMRVCPVDERTRKLN